MCANSLSHVDVAQVTWGWSLPGPRSGSPLLSDWWSSVRPIDSSGPPTPWPSCGTSISIPKTSWAPRSSQRWTRASAVEP
jgi:hypothetical protein